MRMRTRALAALLCTAALVIPAQPATTPNSAITPQTPNVGKVQFLQGTDVAGTYKSAYTGGANGSKIVAIYATSNDASLAHLVTWQISSSTSAHCSPATSCFGGAAVTVPINAGFANAAPAINLMSQGNWPGPVDSDGNTFFFLPSSSYTIEVTFATALTSTDWINVVVVASDF